MSPVTIFLIAFLLGSFPSAAIFTKLFTGQDIRSIGSGNPGAMNTLRNVGLAPGIFCLVTDVTKGAAAVYISTSTGNTDPGIPVALCGVVAGHNFSPWLRFRGGKGLAAIIGALLVISPPALLVFGAVTGLIYASTHNVTAASMGAVAAIPLTLFFMSGNEYWLVVGAVLFVLVSIRHIQ